MHIIIGIIIILSGLEGFISEAKVLEKLSWSKDTLRILIYLMIIIIGCVIMIIGGK